VAILCLTLIPFLISKGSSSTKKTVNSEGKELTIDEQTEKYKVKNYS
jgi:hypothetical protein